MGHYEVINDIEVYIPDVFETGWAEAVDQNFRALANGAGEGGSGGTANLIDATQAPFSADPTGDAFADTAIQDAFDAAFNIGPGSGVWLPGIFKVGDPGLNDNTLAHFEVNGITVTMPFGAKLLVSDDSAKPLFSCLGRHGYPDSQTCDGDFNNITVDGNGRLFKRDVFADWWQGADQNFRDIVAYDLKGSVFNFTAARRPSIKGARLINCGDAENGSAPIDWHHSDEGGTIGRLTEFGTLDDVVVQGSDDFAVTWWLTYACSMTNTKLTSRGNEFLTSSGPYRPAFLGVDMAFCALIGNQFLNAWEDCVRIRSRGVATSGINGTFSHDNVVMGNTALGENQGAGGGGFYGIREFAPYAGVSHAGNVIENNVGTVNRA